MDLATRGIGRTDRSRWTAPVIRLNCPEDGPFVAAGTAQALWEAYDQLLGEGTWWKRQGLGGTIPVRFPSEADPGDAGWHIDGSFDGPDGSYWVNVWSKMRGLLVLVLLTDVDERSAPTRILKGSHLDVPRVLAAAGEGGRSCGPVALRAAEAEIAADLGQTDAADERSRGRPHGHPAIAEAAPAGVAVARDPEVAVDVSADTIRPALDAVDHEVGEELLAGELVVAGHVEHVHVAVAAGVGVAPAAAGADHVQLLVVGREGQTVGTGDLILTDHELELSVG